MKLAFSAYCGMTYEIEHDSRESVRKAAAKFIRKSRNNGQRVVKLRSNAWECQEPESCLMIPDYAGILSIDDKPEIEIEIEEEDEYLN
jgi:hypothetical protein